MSHYAKHSDILKGWRDNVAIVIKRWHREPAGHIVPSNSTLIVRKQKLLSLLVVIRMFPTNLYGKLFWAKY